MSKNKVDVSGLNTNKLKVLSNDRMEELFKLNTHEAKDELVMGNLKLVLSILKRYQNKCENMDDLFQIGVVGLIKAIDNFDLSFGVKFSTYAVFMIEGEIKRYIRDNNQVRISRSIKELSYKVINYRENFLKENNYYPTHEEVCKHFNINEYDLYLVLNSLNDTISIFEPVYCDSGDTIYLLDQLKEESMYSKDDIIALKEALLKLKDRERNVIYKRYIEGLSQSEIALILGISQAQVSRIENSAINSVKKLIL